MATGDRLEPPLPRDRHAVEDASPENLRALRRAALDYVHQQAAELEQLAALLREPGQQSPWDGFVDMPGAASCAP